MRKRIVTCLLAIIVMGALFYGCSVPSTYPPQPPAPQDPAPEPTVEQPSSSQSPPSKDTSTSGSSSVDTYSLESYNYPGYYIRHQNYIGKITRIQSELDRKDSTFRLVHGLAGRCQSFESVNYPGHYLRHQNYKIKLAKADGSPLFREDATFCFRNGLANSSDYSFESYNYPGYYIRHKNYILYIERDRGDLFNKDATFRMKSPNW